MRTNFIVVDLKSSNSVRWAKTMLTALVFILMLFAETVEYCKAEHEEDEKGWLMLFLHEIFQLVTIYFHLLTPNICLNG